MALFNCSLGNYADAQDYQTLTRFFTPTSAQCLHISLNFSLEQMPLPADRHFSRQVIVPLATVRWKHLLIQGKTRWTREKDSDSPYSRENALVVNEANAVASARQPMKSFVCRTNACAPAKCNRQCACQLLSLPSTSLSMMNRSYSRFLLAAYLLLRVSALSRLHATLCGLPVNFCA